MTDSSLQTDVTAVRNIEAVDSILEVICRTTGMGFAAIARVTENHWIACQVRDEINFGLQPGGELKIETTICQEVRSAGEAVFFDNAGEDEVYSRHPIPAMYGFQSYISMPIVLRDGRFFGTLCAIDPRPARVSTPEVVGMFKLFADLIAFHLNAGEQLGSLQQRVAERTADRERAWRLSQDLLVTAEANGTLLTVSQAWTRLLGWQATELVGAAFIDFTHPDDREATNAAFATILKTPLTVPFEFRFRHHDGSYRWFAWTGAFEGGKLYASGRDTTAEHTQAAALAIAEEALRQSQKMEAVGQLTGGLAHDFNNLLTGITGSLELLQTRIVQGRTDELDRYVTAAQGSAQRAAALTHRLLAFSRRQTLDPRSININRLVAGMADLIRHTVQPKIIIEVAAAETLWNTLVDPSQLENALLNLCINARDAMPKGGTLLIETGNRWLDEPTARARELRPGRYVTLCVSDNGTGMAPEVVARAFDPFFTTKPAGLGTGLGLSMIYGFSKQSGGQVNIQSELGRGTSVCLYLPYHPGQAMETASPVTLSDVPHAGHGETVLVIDDEPTVRMLLIEVLQDLGYTAIEAADGATGLTVLESGVRVDLLVADVGLPDGLNGRQVADAARVLRPGLKVLFITGYDEVAVLSHGQLDPGMHVLPKPFAMQTLASRVKQLIDAH